MGLLDLGLNAITGGGWSGGKIALIVVVIASAIGYHYYSVSTLQTDLSEALLNEQTAIENSKDLEDAVDQQNDYITTLQDRRAEDQKASQAVASKYSKAREEAGELKKLVGKHNLNKLSLAKPKMIETIINKATARFGREIEAISKYEEE